MNWNTIYITGRSGFREAIRKKLTSSRLEIMPGYIDNSTSRVDHDLFWIEEHVPLKVFQQELGAKLVFKYRLRFYTQLEDFVEQQMNGEEVVTGEAEHV